jgi:lipopolysaccharide/colanic/teichoic acid biosynthesis glycosyltransferase
MASKLTQSSAAAFVIKRSIDFVGAAMGLFIAAPLFLAIGLAIKLDTPGPIFYCQKRAGKGGQPFTIIKFRSMVADAEKRLPEVKRSNPLAGIAFKIPDDPRVTRVGRLLRRWSLDEIPQFINVLKGEMSLVGPRPEELAIVREYNDYELRQLRVRPGMTGPVQVSGRGDLTLAQRLPLVLDYIDNYSLCSDLDYLIRTIPAIIRGKGAY